MITSQQPRIVKTGGERKFIIETIKHNHLFCHITATTGSHRILGNGLIHNLNDTAHCNLCPKMMHGKRCSHGDEKKRRQATRMRITRRRALRKLVPGQAHRQCHGLSCTLARQLGTALPPQAGKTFQQPPKTKAAGLGSWAKQLGKAAPTVRQNVSATTTNQGSWARQLGKAAPTARQNVSATNTNHGCAILHLNRHKSTVNPARVRSRWNS